MTEATPTIVERLLEPKAPLFYTDSTMRTIEMQRPLPIEREAAAEITRLQSELNTALERVKVLEEAHRKIASTPYCGFAITSGLSRSDLEELVGTFWKEFETRVSISSAVLQSSGGK